MQADARGGRSLAPEEPSPFGGLTVYQHQEYVNPARASYKLIPVPYLVRTGTGTSTYRVSIFSAMSREALGETCTPGKRDGHTDTQTHNKR